MSEPLKVWEQSDVESKVYRYIPSGRDNARTSQEIRSAIRQATGEYISDPAFRATVKRLIETYGLPIGSSPSTPPGFFLIHDPVEMQEVISGLLSRAYSIIARVSALKKISFGDAVRQLELFGVEDVTREGKR